MQLIEAATLDRKSGGAQDLRCAIRVPRSYRPTTATNHHRILMETNLPFVIRVSTTGPRNRRSLRLRSG